MSLSKNNYHYTVKLDTYKLDMDKLDKDELAMDSHDVAKDDMEY